MLMNGRSFFTVKGGIKISVMDFPAVKKVYFHYNHTDSCKSKRWTSRECYQFMYERPWRQVVDFYSNLVDRHWSLSSLFGVEQHLAQNMNGMVEAFGENTLVNASGEDKTGRWARITYKIVLSYHGGSFDGWQKQPGLNTVQGIAEKALGIFVDERKVQQLKEKSLPVEGCAFVAGRTDKGVTALQQVCSFYTWRKDVNVGDIEAAINSAAPGKLRAVSISKVSRVFHPNFSAKWRRYLYIFPIKDEEEERDHEGNADGESNSALGENVEKEKGWVGYDGEGSGCLEVEGEEGFDGRKKPRSFSINRVNQILRQLEGKSLSYKMFARDTKASRSIGPPTECFVYHARAMEARLPCLEEVHAKVPRVMCVELVANRFLRKMVRVLVATSIREAAAGAEDDALLKLMDATCRRATAPPAPPDGLCLVDVGYEDFESENSLIT